mmetsp:Transcript_45319/g.142065  ORF Transcript_45319/g.142065 Transcript_45319/m.142065 type:complete len:265 (+) Transcript_45319:855-1649(+)
MQPRALFDVKHGRHRLGAVPAERRLDLGDVAVVVPGGHAEVDAVKDGVHHTGEAHDGLHVQVVARLRHGERHLLAHQREDPHELRVIKALILSLLTPALKDLGSATPDGRRQLNFGDVNVIGLHQRYRAFQHRWCRVGVGKARGPQGCIGQRAREGRGDREAHDADADAGRGHCVHRHGLARSAPRLRPPRGGCLQLHLRHGRHVVSLCSVSLRSFFCFFSVLRALCLSRLARAFLVRLTARCASRWLAAGTYGSGLIPQRRLR